MAKLKYFLILLRGLFQGALDEYQAALGLFAQNVLAVALNRVARCAIHQRWPGPRVRQLFECPPSR